MRLSVASVTQAPWGGSTFKSLNSAWGKSGCAFSTRHGGLTPDLGRDADWLSGQLWNKNENNDIFYKIIKVLNIELILTQKLVNILIYSCL